MKDDITENQYRIAGLIGAVICIIYLIALFKYHTLPSYAGMIFAFIGLPFLGIYLFKDK
ncbi:hypothetical protein [Bacteroides caecimuris]|uniref:hypothetical protein n=1 Tax=Bacteroides caecimuris TaxID=1796613 RepID=UPI00138EDD58|nr:hypothetical protein [Bacteroides caecimuris]